ncbi:MAG: diguanylate cyclase [Planctomycetaceae bacterium]|nr:diguanylate cyclase [Planctomycetaceae bacterium]
MEAVAGHNRSKPNASMRPVPVAPRGLTSLMQLHCRAIELEQINLDSPSKCPVAPSILRDLLTSLHYRDENTFLHSRRVSLIAVGLAKQLCWNAEAIQNIEMAAMLHDIGKIGIPDHILYKPGSYTVEEASLMGLRTSIAEDILQVCRVPQQIREIIVEAQLPYSGLEDYLRPVGRDISQAGRLLAVADVYESMTRDQVYREAKTQKEIIEYLTEKSGTLYDASVVQTLIRWLSTGGEEMIRKYGTPSGLNNSLESSSGSLALTSLCNVFSYLYSIEQTYKGFVITDADGRILLANRGCREIFQHHQDDLTGCEFTAELFPQANMYQEFLPQEELPLRKALRMQIAETSELKVTCPDKEWVELEVQTIPLFDDNGEMSGVSEFYRVKDQNLVESAQYRQLALEASRDALTGVANRGTLENQLSRAMSNFNEDHNNLFSVIYLDIDHFKSINDTYGHAAGDEVLVKLARLLREETYTSEFVARYGGEEFVIICAELDAELAVKRAERFRALIPKLTFDLAPSLKITSSFGVSQVEPNDSLESVLKRADSALYESKNKGRNRTTLIKRQDVHQQKEKEENPGNSFVFEADLGAVLFDDFLILKLHGFVDEHKGKLLKVREGVVKIQIGRKTLFGGWGRSQDKQPVCVTVDASAVVKSRGKLSNSQKVKIQITPMGRIRKASRFQSRAKSVYRLLKSHFVTQQ